MAQRRQRGGLKKETRIQGETCGSIFELRESSMADGLKTRSLLGSSAIFPTKQRVG
jgi:hypothetical protein